MTSSATGGMGTIAMRIGRSGKKVWQAEHGGPRASWRLFLL